MRRQRPGDRLGFRQLEGRAQVRVKVPAERELDRIRDRDVGLAERDALEQVERIGCADLGPRRSGACCARCARAAAWPELRCTTMRRPTRSAGVSRQRILHAIDDVLVDPLVRRARSGRDPRGPRRRRGRPQRHARGFAPPRERGRRRAHPLKFEPDAEALGEPAGQFVFRALGTRRAFVVGEGAVARHDLERALRRGPARACPACASRCLS